MRIDSMRDELTVWQNADCEADRFLGCHRINENERVFRVWAPNASAVCVCGDFNGWSHDAAPMTRVSGNGVWECKIEGAAQYDNYKYGITAKDGRFFMKSDPYAYHYETRPATASKVYDLPDFPWGDGEWLSARAARDHFRSPMNIYELHAGSWFRPDGREPSYRELADKLIPYVKDMGFTHVELLPVTEYPFDGSWGYQVTGYFAPTSRYGTPEDFMYFVDACHRNGVGVITDWVPAHFPKDAAGLYEFDGEPLYEYNDPLMREHIDWGTRIFDYSRPEVVSFLVSSARFWLDTYHIDGLRVDAVASMLYLDYGRKEFKLNRYGGNGNLEAVEFIKLFNTVAHRDRPGVFTVAEESTAWPLVTAPVESGGLGFDYKWSMGWMNDTLRYMSATHERRHGMQNLMSFSTTYAFSENFILPLSHDEVVHGKCSLVDKMPGYYDDKFANLRAYAAYMYTHPGKKLVFMGSEFAHFREWVENKSLDWFLLDYPNHDAFKRFSRDLNKLYLSEPSLWERDCGYDGFNWISADDSDNCVYAYRRVCERDEIIVLLNFSAYTLENYRVGLPFAGEYTLILSSDDRKYGGEERRLSAVTASELPLHGQSFSGEFTLPPFSALLYKKSHEETTDAKE